MERQARETASHAGREGSLICPERFDALYSLIITPRCCLPTRRLYD